MNSGILSFFNKNEFSNEICWGNNVLLCCTMYQKCRLDIKRCNQIKWVSPFLYQIGSWLMFPFKAIYLINKIARNPIAYWLQWTIFALHGLFPKCFNRLKARLCPKFLTDYIWTYRLWRTYLLRDKNRLNFYTPWHLIFKKSPWLATSLTG